MAPVRDALDTILAGHEPFPAVIVDRRWDLVAANTPALQVLADGVAPALLSPPANAMRVCLHPDGLAPCIGNLAEYSAHLLGRLRRQIVLSPDPVVEDLVEELRHYPGVEDAATTAIDPATMLFVPLCLRTRTGDELTFFSTLATFGTPLDITLAELSIESFFPADRETEAALQAARG
jgi:hypothetical protein